MVGEEKRSEMMLNLFGDQSEEEEIDSEHESNPQPNYPSVTLSLLFSFGFVTIVSAFFICIFQAHCFHKFTPWNVFWYVMGFSYYSRLNLGF